MSRGIARASGPSRYAFALALLVCLLGSTVFAQKQPDISQPTILPPEQAIKEGRALADEILAQRPAENAQTVGMMTIRDAKDRRTRIPIRFGTIVTATNWVSFYEATELAGTRTLTIAHNGTRPVNTNYPFA